MTQSVNDLFFKRKHTAPFFACTHMPKHANVRMSLSHYHNKNGATQVQKNSSDIPLDYYCQM